MMLAPKEFDPVNRDLEIRDLYNMEDAFHLGDSYAGAYRARLNANLAFWDGLDGKVDWPTGRGRQPPADRPGPRRLPRRRRHQALRRAGLVPRDRARRPTRRAAPDLRGTDLERRRDGHDLHPAGQRRPRPHHPRRRRLRHPAGHRHVPLPGGAQPEPARAPRAPLSDGRRLTRHGRRRPHPTWSSTTSRPARCSSVPRRTSARTCCCASRTAPTAASSSGGCTGSSALARTSDERGRHVAHRRVHLPRARGARGAAGVAGQLRAGVPGRDGGPRRRAGRRR